MEPARDFIGHLVRLILMSKIRSSTTATESQRNSTKPSADLLDLLRMQESIPQPRERRNLRIREGRMKLLGESQSSGTVYC